MCSGSLVQGFGLIFSRRVINKNHNHSETSCAYTPEVLELHVYTIQWTDEAQQSQTVLYMQLDILASHDLLSCILYVSLDVQSHEVQVLFVFLGVGHQWYERLGDGRVDPGSEGVNLRLVLANRLQERSDWPEQPVDYVLRW